MLEQSSGPVSSVARKDSSAGTMCMMCRGGQRVIALSELNALFLEKRIAEDSVNAALDISRIAWDHFPRLTESADARRTAEFLMEGLQEKINLQVLMPISNTTAAMSAMIDRLENLIDSNPALIEQGFNKALDGFKTEINIVKSAIHEPGARISELSQMVSQLVYKPTVKGAAGEAVLTDLLIEYFSRDQVLKYGGAGREDILVTPYLDEGTPYFGERIVVERKTGKQKYNGLHREEAIRHAKEKGASFAMLIYDNQENLPQVIRPVSISRQQGILLIVADLQSGTWKMMRETIDVIQRIIGQSKKGIEEINIDSIQEVITELGTMVKLAEQIKGTNSKIRTCADDVEQSVVTIKALVKSYQVKLQTAIIGISSPKSLN
jgi:hypothetical protein